MRKIPLPPEIRSARGFTLIEAVAVLILLGILAAVAIARVADNDADERAAADKLKVHLRYAQMRAMNHADIWGVEATGGSYFLFYGGDINNKARFSGGEDLSISFPSGISASFTVSFDEWGRPYSVPNPSEGDDTTTITIDIGSGITITQETGFIQ